MTFVDTDPDLATIKKLNCWFAFTGQWFANVHIPKTLIVAFARES